ncbi:hypothetical protein TRFO_33299 [Tritrichomonas foetus]|uniref:Uncharacterized protein n=1 Tax=Tritrichomonas foetus TaxID=1144522 RepID=A0A1J4JMZ8_9EUKA|nr:hypothetical protein TRFO_33299 [Tritrichomonas foetus]|eukprot:OHT00066.1 hypothetical protein TRFO_33299 [Tritrichomonas foetus]
MLFHYIIYLINSWEPPLPDLSYPQKAYDPKIDSYYFRKDSMYYSKFDFKKAFKEYNALLKYDFTLINNENKTESIPVTLYYSPLISMKCPIENSCHDLEDIGDSDTFLCWILNGSDLCYPIGYQNKYKISVTADPQFFNYDTMKPNPDRYKVPGFHNYIFQATLHCSKGNDFTNNQNATFVKDGDLSIFNFEFSSGICPINAREPIIPSYPNSQNPLDELPSFDFYQQTEEDYVNYSLTQFEPFQSTVLQIIAPKTFEYVFFIFNPSNESECPVGYICPDDNASIWKCWDGFLGDKHCVSVANYRWGFVLHSNSFLMFGGRGDYYVELKMQCNENIPNNLMKVKNAVQSLTNEIQIVAETSATCYKEIYIPKIEKKPSFGAFFIIFIWSVITVFIGGSMIVEFALKGILVLPFYEIFAEIGYCILEGWETITCLKGPGGNDIPEPGQNTNQSIQYSTM